MRAWHLVAPGSLESRPLRYVEAEVPRPGAGEVLVEVAACGVCRTDLHIVEGDLRVHRERVVPGHQVVGRVAAVGERTTRFEVGNRVGIAWLRHTCGTCRFCRDGRENLCLTPRFTGWDDDGGFAEYATVSESYAYPLPEGPGDEELAPLLCAGIIGFRALKRSAVPPGGQLGIYGFGASAHITAQVAVAWGVEVHVVTRSAPARALALELGAASARDPAADLRQVLDAAIVFAPAGDVVRLALESVDRGGLVVVGGIHVTNVPELEYERHLFHERTLTSVAANTRRDAEEFLAVAARTGVRARSVTYPLERADDALSALAAGSLVGAAVLLPPRADDSPGASTR
jgi:propanol-preferring alcohol dehydrogenase